LPTASAARSGRAGRKGVSGEGDSRPALAFAAAKFCILLRKICCRKM